ncbi:basic proline-rich protein-like [Mastomys coucha]|uniref:basic proline-rich protein-like n=1 Tax=Mastomys coucha TaxID=35658 RepID=UPI0012616468|nr:basic proline-rich protein-like [Mastomys coucha]
MYCLLRGRGPACAHSGIARRRGPARGAARRGRPGTALPPAGAARAPPTAPPPPRHAAGQNCGPPAGLRAPGSAPTPVVTPRRRARLRAPSGHGSSRELGAACRDTEREKRVTAGTPWVPRPTRPAFRARPLRLPPAAAPSAGSLRPPPPPPPPSSAAAAAAGKGAEETASLPLPNAQAHLRPDRSEERDLGKESGPRAQRHGRHAPGGRGYGGSRGSRGRLAEPAGVWLAVRPPVALRGSPRFSFAAARRRGADPRRVGFVGP